MTAAERRSEVCRRWQAKPFMEGDEAVLIYFSSDRLVLATSTLAPGQKSSRDPGHAGAHEVVYCVRGEITLEIGDGDGEFLRLMAGDGALVREGVAHAVFNTGGETAEMVWCTAPSLGRPAVYEEDAGPRR